MRVLVRRRPSQSQFALGAATLILTVLVALAVVAAFVDSDYLRVAVPCYVTGGGTLALAGATVWLTLQDRSERRQLERRNALRQARRVIPRVEPTTGPPHFARVINHSDEPIMNVSIVTVDSDECFGWDPEPDHNGVDVIPAHGSHLFKGTTYPKRRGEVEVVDTTRDQLWQKCLVEIHWADVRGLYWERVGPRNDPQRE